MHLTQEEEAMLAGEEGAGVQLAMRLLVNLGEFYHAPRLIEVASAQISGVSYKTGGEGLLDILEELDEGRARVRVPAYLNPAGMDLEHWEAMGIPAAFAEKQLEIIEHYTNLGVLPTCTCTPYLVGNIAKLGDHLAWSESSAVAFANSYFGARTNREGGISALASAIVGKTPLFGLHRLENRLPQVHVKVKCALEPGDHALIGHYIGRASSSKIPYFQGLKIERASQIKALGAAMAASGAVALFHIEYVTPEYKLYMKENIEKKITITAEDLRRLRTSFRPLTLPDLVAVGCPHADIEEIGAIARQLEGKTVDPLVKFWIFTAAPVLAVATRAGYRDIIEAAGGKLFCDTCMVVSPLAEIGIQSVVTNSAKAAHYLPSMNKTEASCCSLEECIQIALEGKLPSSLDQKEVS